METKPQLTEAEVQAKLDQMDALLKKLGIPYKDIRVGQYTILITCVAHATACKWVPILRRFCTNVKAWQTIEEKQDGGASVRKANPGRVCSGDKYTHVWRVRGNIGKNEY